MRPPLKSRSDLHLPRKIFHLTSLLFIFICMVFLPRWVCWSIYAAIGIPMILIDFSRKFYEPLNQLFLKCIGPVLRDEEENQASGAAYSLIGVALVYALFDAPIAELSVLFLAIGDPTASFVGLKIGGPKLWHNKSVSGAFACMLVCGLAASLYIMLFLNYQSLQNSPPVLPFPGLVKNSLIFGLIAGFSEAFPIYKLDDNLSQPLISSTLMYMLILIGSSW